MTDNISYNSLQIECPSCGHEFSLSAAVLSQVREAAKEELQESFSKKQAEANAQLKEAKELRETLRKQEDALKEKSESIETLVAAKLKEQSVELARKAEAKVRDDLSVQLKAMQEERDEKANALKLAQAAELDLRKAQRQLEDDKQQLALKVERTLADERSKIREEAAKQASEEQRLKLAEKDGLVEDLKKRLAEMTRKAEQGSQQTQGEILEMGVESALRERFPADDLVEVPKGIRGVDVMQAVRSPSGRRAGTIAIEIKRTKSWSGSWIPKLRDDQRAVSADVAMIVSEVVPEEVDGFEFVDGVWVCDAKSYLALITSLRYTLIEVNAQRVANENRDDKQAALFAYITSPDFRLKVEGLIQSFESLRSELEREKRAMTRIWNERAKAIDKAVSNTAAMFGDVRSLSGNSVQSIESLELSEA